MFENKEQQWQYIVENYPEVTDQRINQNHWDLLCPKCNLRYGFQVVKKWNFTVSEEYITHDRDLAFPIGILFRCPVCATYKIWLVYLRTVGKVTKFYKVTSIPSDGMEDLDALPTEPPALRIAYKQAIRSMDANAHIAAAAMFRRALQVITREILGAKKDDLFVELKELHTAGKISQTFADNAYIVRKSGGQAAHPDPDPDLLDFKAEDAAALQDIFMEIVSELYIQPEAAKKAREDYLKSRKIIPPSSKTTETKPEKEVPLEHLKEQTQK